ncbi:MAG TPA: ATP-binding protein [Lacunisphaera sp.]|nr:ATP-binding protein [Lacunisphaera sp.]
MSRLPILATERRPQSLWPRARWLVALVSLILGPALRAAPTAAEPTVPREAIVGPMINNVGEFWNIPEIDKPKPHRIRLQLLVLYYDPIWHLLWAQEDGKGCYMTVHGEALPMRAGQRVRIEGTIIPTEGLDGSRVAVTVLDNNAMPPALPTAGALADFGRFDIQYVQFEGYVFSQSDADPTHTVFMILSENQLVTLRLLLNGTEPVPQVVGARVRVRAVYVATRDPAGSLQSIDCWSANRSDLEVIDWIAEDSRFNLPRTPIDQLAAKSDEAWVHLVGSARAQDPGHSLTLRDDTGQLVLRTVQPEVLPANAGVEVIGQPFKDERGWTLRDVLFRRTDVPAANDGALQRPGQVPVRLRLAEQVTQLRPDEAARKFPVTLRGVVTWSDEHAPYFFLQDASGGVRVEGDPGKAAFFPIGSSLLVNGVTAVGALVPKVEMLEVNFLGTMALPTVRTINLEQALSGAEENRRVEMRGLVRLVTRDHAWTRLDLTGPTGEFTAYLPYTDNAAAVLTGAIVRVRGVCTSQANAARELTGISLWVSGMNSIYVDTPAPSDPFAGPVQSIASLRQPGAGEAIYQRVHVAGRVLLHVPGRYLYLQNGDAGIFVLTRETKPVAPGTAVELSGFPGRAGSRLVLREAVWRPGADVPELEPLKFVPTEVPTVDADARLVQFEGRLRQSVRAGTENKLTLQVNDTVFDATLTSAPDWVPPAPGSRLALTGVYVQEFDEYRHPHGFHLELRSPSDIAILARPPWWTLQRTFYAVGALLCCTLLVLGWVLALRRQVRSQTELIRRQMENEARLQAELERSSRLESLGVLAGGIAHDFNNLLTAILGNLGLAAMDPRVMAAAGDCLSEAERAARRARDVTQQLLTFAKGGDPIRAAVLLPDVITEAANFARHGSSVRLEFNFPHALPPGDVDASQISRVVHNLVINAVQAMPGGGLVKIGLQAVELKDRQVDQLAAGRYLELTVADTGAGIAPENLPRIFDPYFSTKTKNNGLGLATVRSIVKKHRGHIEVESRVGQGTTFRLWLPAATTLGSAAADPEKPASNGPARVLVMDDEEVIRRVAGRMLSLAGHETAFAADGADALRLYDEAARVGRPFDLVIFDLTVPGGMGGREALATLLQSYPNARAIASSGYSNDPVMANPQAFGFRTQLSKPYEFNDLVRAVDEARRN